MSDALTPAQQMILDFLKDRIQKGVPPSVREICEATGIRSTSSVHNHLCALEKGGYITRTSGRNRHIQLADESPVTQVPLIGHVAAGSPLYAFEDVVAHIPFPGNNYDASQLFALRVRGESMINAGILDGDIIIAEKTPTAAYDGEIVIAMIEDEATVKRIYREGDAIRLQPENDLYEPIITRNVSVIGRVISCIRYYG